MSAADDRPPPVRDNRRRILDAALDVLGRKPDASMADVAAAAGVVRRTVYGHFPARAELVVALTEQAVAELVGVLAEVDAPDRPAERVWAAFVDRTWPVAQRYRVLLALRRSELSGLVHATLGPLDETLAELVRRGQGEDAFGRHLPAPLLSQMAYAAVFSVAEQGLTDDALDAGTAVVASLLVLGVPRDRARILAGA